MGETTNEVAVTYTRAAVNFSPATESVQDAANLNSQGGRRRRSEFSFPGCTRASLARFLASRELNFLSRPIMRLRIQMQRSATILRPGDPFRFQWADYGASGLDAVFRVGEMDVGTLDDGTVTITAVQDRFAIPGTLWDGNESVSDEGGGAAAYPTPILLRTITEAPRWIQLKAFEAGTLANVDAQRGMYLARAGGSDDRYRVDTDDAGDLAARTFPGRFETDDVYLRTQGPYDTTGIQIRAVAGWTPTSATPTQIATEGRNLIQIDGEILAFETATFVSGTTWTLDNVWRGVLDTVPADHAEGATGYVLPGSFAGGAIGSRVLVHGTSYEATTLAAAGTTWTPADESPVDTLTATSRVRRPYPVDALLVNGSQSPAALSDDGVTMTWAKRDRTKGTITRPTRRRRRRGRDRLPRRRIQGHGAARRRNAGDAAGWHHLGDHALPARRRRPRRARGRRRLGAGGDVARRHHADAHGLAGANARGGGAAPPEPDHQRQVRRRRRTTGPRAAARPAQDRALGSLGGGGTMITAASGTTTLTFYQDIPIQGYDPADLRALLTFAAGRRHADANDTFAVTMTSRDASNNVLDTATIAATHPAAWDRYDVGSPTSTSTPRRSVCRSRSRSRPVGDGGDTTSTSA